MAREMNLTAEQIYEKEFNVDLKGYTPEEVDDFLDQVIEDYQAYDEKIEEFGQALIRYEEKIKELQSQIIALTNENSNLNKQLGTSMAGANSDMVDILKRIARLEQAVFNKE
ncbi:MAG: DivIVA domain-containing protein [Holdemanella sp.]|nr:DivIVA domain-containing protein [Holdemanella sp.]